MMLLAKLILAHLIGDFILQPRTWVEKKEKNKLKAWQLYIHVVIHLLLILVLVWDHSIFLIALFISIAHLLIDVAKISFQKEKTKRSWFVADQILHGGTILIIWLYFTPVIVDFTIIDTPDFWFILTALVFITAPTSILIKNLISQWAPTSGNMESLPEAGKFIGILERLFILLFILTNHWEAVGFLLAAKSVFRFGDLKDAHDRKLTEYVLIGTLLSFGIAILTGLSLYYLLHQ